MTDKIVNGINNLEDFMWYRIVEKMHDKADSELINQRLQYIVDNKKSNMHKYRDSQDTQVQAKFLTGNLKLTRDDMIDLI